MIIVRVEDASYRTEEVLHQRYDRLSEQRQNKVRKCKQTSRKIESIMAGFALEDELQKLGISHPYEYYFDEDGKPWLKNDDEIDFSITHSKPVVAVAIGRQDLGVDIEHITEQMSAEMSEQNTRLARRFFLEEEYQWIMEDKQLAAARFYQIWTFKEAVAKCLRISLPNVLSNINYLQEFPAREIAGDVKEKNIWIHQWKGTDWMMTLCVQGEEELIKLELEENERCTLIR